jgi:hypothetical protein
MFFKYQIFVITLLFVIILYNPVLKIQNIIDKPKLKGITSLKIIHNPIKTNLIVHIQNNAMCIIIYYQNMYVASVKKFMTFMTTNHSFFHIIP